jgi:DHA1 family inner membrane transport protein
VLALAFASNFLWVLVLGLLGPSLPAIVSDLGISYAQAGLFFTLLSLGSFFGTSLGSIASDRLPRKALFAACAALLAAGLLVLGFMRSYVLLALLIFLLSLLGSPVGAVGQSIMLGMFPSKRERNLSLMTSFGAVGSLLAPVLVSLNYTARLAWRWPFTEAAALAFLLFIAILALPIPPAGPPRERQRVLAILKNRRVAGAAVMIFFSIAIDLGFSYWLAEYFAAELHVSLGLSSSVVGIYLVGIVAGRFLIPLVLKRISPERHLGLSLSVALAGMLLFILVPSVPVKAALCALYGLGVGPVFPLLMARGSREFPEQPGAVTGVLFGSMSLGGMVFPLLVGSIAAGIGIARTYWFCAVVACGLLVAALAGQRVAREPPARRPPA